MCICNFYMSQFNIYLYKLSNLCFMGNFVPLSYNIKNLTLYYSSILNQVSITHIKPYSNDRNDSCLITITINIIKIKSFKKKKTFFENSS